MRNSRVLLFSFVAFGVSSYCFGQSLEFENLSGDTIKSHTITVASDLPSSNRKASSSSSPNVVKYDWSLAVTQAKVINPATSTSPEVDDNTTSIATSVNGETPTKLNYGLDFNYDDTPDEWLVDMGPTLNFGKTWLGPEEQLEDSTFTPKFKAGISLGYMYYDETFSSGRIKRKNGTVVLPKFGSNTISQRSLGFTASYKPKNWFRVKAGIKGYQYSKDVNEFLQYLDTKNTKAVGGLSDALSGFANSDVSVEADFYFLETWEVDVSDKVSKIATDSSLTKTFKATLFDDITDQWRAGVGLQNVTSTSQPITPPENDLYLMISYDWD